MLKGVATGCFTPQTPTNRMFDLRCGYQVFWDEEVITLACSLHHVSLCPPLLIGVDKGCEWWTRGFCYSIHWKPPACLLPLVFLSSTHTPLFKNVGTSCAWPNTLGVQEASRMFPWSISKSGKICIDLW